ncbi:MAG: response regulator [Lachnospiraceae bacterium]|nr:response regulator [Lachnospiraceae bacterium]
MKTVLIVEDEKMIRQGIRTMIQRSGVPVEIIMECNNGEMALEILEEQKIDVMFTDIRMPKMNGIELVQNMQKLEHKPITVAISGYADFSYAVEMMRLGVREYILKPIEREKLIEILKKIEEELIASQISSQNSKQLGNQQLKYLILNEQITEEEMNTLQAEYENDFCLQQFYLCIVNPQEIDNVRDQYIYLHNIEENDVYLVSEENLEFLLKNELIKEYIGISNVHSGIREIKTAYVEALKARRRAFCNNKEIVRCNEPEKKIPEALQQEAAKYIEAESRLRRVQLLGTDKTEDIVRLWNGFFENVKKGRISPEAFKECMDSFFEEVKKTYRNIITEDMETIQRLSACYRFSKVDDYETELMNWILGLHERINSQFDTNRNKQKIRQAMDYIQENYDKDLNMAVVSNYISMNYSLFSYMFKEYTGSNFVNYLKGIRMEEAKKLLKETDMRIIEISQQVGYDNEKHFMKTFKATVGVSPSEFRKNAQLQ